MLVYVFEAAEALFQSAWFVESIATQVLVVFVIRTRRRFFESRPHAALAVLASAKIPVVVTH